MWEPVKDILSLVGIFVIAASCGLAPIWWLSKKKQKHEHECINIALEGHDPRQKKVQMRHDRFARELCTRSRWDQGRDS